MVVAEWRSLSGGQTSARRVVSRRRGVQALIGRPDIQRCGRARAMARLISRHSQRICPIDGAGDRSKRQAGRVCGEGSACGVSPAADPSHHAHATWLGWQSPVALVRTGISPLLSPRGTEPRFIAVHQTLTQMDGEAQHRRPPCVFRRFLARIPSSSSTNTPRLPLSVSAAIARAGAASYPPCTSDSPIQHLSCPPHTRISLRFPHSAIRCSRTPQPGESRRACDRSLPARASSTTHRVRC